jgi:acetyl-CoA decarbonylase/synthase complex subunit delta
VASDVQEISKRLEARDVDLVSLSPEPNLDFGTPEAAPKAKAAKPEKKEAAPKPEKKEEKPAPKPKKEEKVVEATPKAEDEAAVKARAEEEAKAKAEAEAKAKAETEAKAKADAEAKAKAEEEARAKAVAEAKAKAEQEVKAKAAGKAKESEDLQALRYQRALEREKHEAAIRAGEEEEIPKTAAKQQLSQVEKLIRNLARIHKRI